jgi:preprotein translocase subunit SecA
MRAFYDGPYGKRLQEHRDICMVTAETENPDHYVARAMKAGRITLYPKEYGRGLDFACRLDAIDAAGGAKVISTFLSEEKSEEVQIKGRTARQNKKGSFAMVLMVKDLAKFGIQPDEARRQNASSDLYAFLDRKRQELNRANGQSRQRQVDAAKASHEEAARLVDALVTSRRSHVIEFLNRGDF